MKFDRSLVFGNISYFFIDKVLRGMDSCLNFVSLFNEKRKDMKNCWDLNVQRQGEEMAANNNSPRPEVGHNIYLLPYGLNYEKGQDAERLSELFGKDLLRATFHTVTDADLTHPEKREVIERAAKAQNAAKPKFWRQI